MIALVTASIESLVVGILVIAGCAALAFFGLRAVGEAVWASRVAALIIGVGAILLLLLLL